MKGFNSTWLFQLPFVKGLSFNVPDLHTPQCASRGSPDVEMADELK